MKVATILVALVGGGAPLLAGTVALTPFLLSTWNLLSPLWAIYTSVSLIMAMLFVLGIFLGRVSEENLIISGIKTLVIGLATATIVILVSGFGG